MRDKTPGGGALHATAGVVLLEEEAIYVHRDTDRSICTTGQAEALVPFHYELALLLVGVCLSNVNKGLHPHLPISLW